MYDTAKRGMVFAVATGGLLFAGAAHAAAETPSGVTEIPGGQTAAQLDPGTATLAPATHDMRRMPEATRTSHDSAPIDALGRTVAALATAPRGVLSGDSIKIPTTLSVNVCGNAIAVLGTAVSQANCSSAESGTAAAGGVLGSRGGLLSAIGVLAPIDVPVNACGNVAAVGGMAVSAPGATCAVADETGSLSSSGAATGAAAASSVARILDEVLTTATGATTQASIDVPVNACGNGLAAKGLSGAAVTCAITEHAPASAASSSESGTPSGGTTPGSTASGSVTSGSASASSTATYSSSTSSTALSLPDTAPNAGTSSGPDAGAGVVAQPQAPQPQVLTQNVAAPGAPTPTCPKGTGASAVSAASKPQPNAVAVAVAKPLLVHPVVIWPRPESAAMMAAEGTGSGYRTAPHSATRDPAGMSLAHTGAATVVPLSAAAATLTGGIGLRALGQHRRRVGS